MSTPLLELQEITKTFPGAERPVVANDKVSLTLYPGEVHALVGENGTGKSTLMNILYGLLPSDSGHILLRGQPLHLRNPRDAIAQGIGMVHQHFMLIPSFTVAENLVFSFEPKKNGVFVDLPKAIKITRELSEKYGLHVDPSKKISECPLSMQQRVEILKILFHKAEVLIFDEPTAVLTPQEADELFHAFEELKKDGKSIVFITHKLREVMAVADVVTVMRKGKVVDTVRKADTSVDALADMMVGRKVQVAARKAVTAPETRVPLLEVSKLTTRKTRVGAQLRNLTFSLCEGEILGIAGVGGNGQEQLVSLLTGLSETVSQGQVCYRGRDITGADAGRMRELGIAHITGERYIRGISSVCTIHDNLIMGAHRREPWAGKVFLRLRALRKLAADLISRFSILASSPQMPIMSLSGGNIQKCILARELNLAREVIIAEEPTRGVDIGSIEYIHDTLVARAQEKFGIMLVSTDLDEVMALSTRVLVMYEGEIVGEVDPTQPDARQRIGLLMAGITQEGGAA